MELNISCLDKIVGHQICNRKIEKVSIANRYRGDTTSYVFHFPEIPHYNYGNTYKQWESEFEVHLYRTPKNNKYELFWMGLHGVTCAELSKEDIGNFDKFIEGLVVVVQRGKQYWMENR